jgi:CRP-like cAMP-binding protein
MWETVPLRKSDRFYLSQGAVMVNALPRSVTSNLKNSRTDGNGNEVHNRILLGLPKKECGFVLSKLTFLDLRLHDLLHEAGQPIRYCYFPNTAMASILNVMDDGKSVEVGLAGKEGFVGLPVVAGFRSSASRVVTQAQGTAFRIAADDMREALRKCSQLVVALLRYSQEATMEVTQIAACNRLHEIDERLARWLLMSHDRIGKDILPLTQEFLSQMLGTRRASVSVAAAILQKTGLIHYTRGHVTILNRNELEKACCECYAVIQRQLVSWQKEIA